LVATDGTSSYFFLLLPRHNNNNCHLHLCRMSSSSSLLGWLVLVLLVIDLGSTFHRNGAVVTALTVKQLPHLQTFDSWGTCVYDGGCYEQDCSSAMMGGWATPALADILFVDQTFGWWVNSGLTPSNKNPDTREMLTCDQALTGPCADHTTNSNGKYLYAEASGCGDRPLMATSPFIVFTASDATLTFWYYYYGSNINTATKFEVTMSATTDDGTTRNSTIWTNSGGSTKEWQSVTISLSSFFPSDATAANPVTTVFSFKVTPSDNRNNFRADIAIDDVLFTQSGVPTVSPPPYIDPSPSPSPSPATGRPAPVSTGSGGLSDSEIGGIVGGVVGGLILLTLLLGVLLVVILLIISPKAPAGPAPAPNTVL